MIGDPRWFQRRRYGGWGLAPKTWQGWVYVAVLVLIIASISLLPKGWQMPAYILAGIVFMADFIHILLKMKKDERETLHEALAERNAMWVMVTVLGIGIAYQAASSAIAGEPYVDPVILIALVCALIAKAATNIYLERRR